MSIRLIFNTSLILMTLFQGTLDQKKVEFVNRNNFTSYEHVS